MEWAAEKKMNCFLSVGQGSSNPPAFLELHYKGSDHRPIVLVGKGNKEEELSILSKLSFDKIILLKNLYLDIKSFKFFYKNNCENLFFSFRDHF